MPKEVSGVENGPRAGSYAGVCPSLQFGKLGSSATVDKLVEAIAYVPRHWEIAYVELAVEPEVVEVGEVMSRGEMLEKLVGKSPTAAIEIGGIPVGCVLGTGARTSLMPSSFNYENLAGVVGLDIGTFTRIVGVNGLHVPFEGCHDVLITIFGQTIKASVLVKQDATDSRVERNASFSVP